MKLRVHGVSVVSVTGVHVVQVLYGVFLVQVLYGVYMCPHGATLTWCGCLLDPGASTEIPAGITGE